MSGECDKCGEHCLECMCLPLLEYKPNFRIAQPNITPIMIELSKRFQARCDKWDDHRLECGCTMSEEERTLIFLWQAYGSDKVDPNTLTFGALQLRKTLRELVDKDND